MRRMLEHLYTLEGMAEREVPTAARSLLELPLAVSRLFGVRRRARLDSASSPASERKTTAYLSTDSRPEAAPASNPVFARQRTDRFSLDEFPLPFSEVGLAIGMSRNGREKPLGVQQVL